MKPAVLPSQPSKIARAAWLILPLSAAAILAALSAEVAPHGTSRLDTAEFACAPRDTEPAPAPLAGVVQLGPTEFQVDRALLERWLDVDPARAVRVIPSYRHGVFHGLKLYAIRRGSLPAALGMQNGDTIVTVNGARLDSPEQALAAFAATRHRRQIDLELMRGGEVVVLHYAIAS